MAKQHIRISKADHWFSLFIRIRDGWTCKRCGAYDPPKPDSASHLQNSHYFGRTMLPVRWDEENCDTLCHGCHRYWEKEDREGYRDFKVKQLGQKRFDLLMARAHLPNKIAERYYEWYYYHNLYRRGLVPHETRYDHLKITT